MTGRYNGPVKRRQHQLNVRFHELRSWLSICRASVLRPRFEKARRAKRAGAEAALDIFTVRATRASEKRCSTVRSCFFFSSPTLFSMTGDLTAKPTRWKVGEGRSCNYIRLTFLHCCPRRAGHQVGTLLQLPCPVSSAGAPQSFFLAKA